MGAVITAYFASMCIIGSDNISIGATRQLISLAVILIIPSVLGAISAFMFFIYGKKENAYPILIFIAAIWGIVRLVVTNCHMMIAAGNHVSMNTTLNILLRISIYGLIMYQTKVLWNKRRGATESN